MKTRGDIVFNSGDGVAVDIVEIKARLKSPESMFTKLGKEVEGDPLPLSEKTAKGHCSFFCITPLWISPSVRSLLVWSIRGCGMSEQFV